MSRSPAAKRSSTPFLSPVPGVITAKINGLVPYFVNDRMFACINGNGVGLRLPAAVATELHFSRGRRCPVSARRYGKFEGVDTDQPNRCR
jgi:hypothetical protein